MLAVGEFFAGHGAAIALFGYSLFSAATLVALSTFSISTIISNRASFSKLAQRHRRGASAINAGRTIMATRRAAIFTIIALACLFAYRLDSLQSSTIALLFDSVLIQLLPAMIAGVYWSRAHLAGAIAGIGGG